MKATNTLRRIQGSKQFRPSQCERISESKECRYQLEQRTKVKVIIYVVVQDYGYDGSAFRHVFASMEEARAWCMVQFSHEDFSIEAYNMVTHTSTSEYIVVQGTK